MTEASNPIGQAKHGGDHSSRAAQFQARENEQRALELWLKGATFEQIAAAGFGVATASGAWRAVRRALARIPKEEADQARQAQLARLQALRLLLWNHAASDPIKAAEALIRLEAREARLLGLDMPASATLEVTTSDNERRRRDKEAEQLKVIRAMTPEERRQYIEIVRRAIDRAKRVPEVIQIGQKNGSPAEEE